MNVTKFFQTDSLFCNRTNSIVQKEAVLVFEFFLFFLLFELTDYTGKGNLLLIGQ